MQCPPQSYDPSISRWTEVYSLFLLELSIYRRSPGEFSPTPLEVLRISNAGHFLGLTGERSDELQRLAAEFAACQLQVESASSAKAEDSRLSETQQAMLATPAADRDRDYFQNIKRTERRRCALIAIIQHGKAAVVKMELIRRALRDI